MSFKIGKNFKQKHNIDDTLEELENNINEKIFDNYYKQKIINSSSNASNKLFNPSYISQINYFGIVSELPDVNEAEIGQLVLKQDNDNYIIYLFNGKSWVELSQSTYDIRIDSADDYTDIYGNSSWRTCIDNRITCDVRLKEEPIYDRDSIIRDCI